VRSQPLGRERYKIRQHLAMPQNQFVGPIAERYDADSTEMFEPALLRATADFLTTEARGGRALEFGIGTGRVAIPLSQRGIDVHGIDISADMINQLRRKAGSDAVATTIGDFAETVVSEEEFSVVYVVFNSIANLLDQAEWVQTFRNAARHLQPGGRFVMELWVPDLRRFSLGAIAIPFDVTPQHLGFDTLDIATQRCMSHHYFVRDSHVDYIAGEGRYAWPAELDLMAQIAGMSLLQRWGDWDRSPFTSESPKHISVWERP
jgi:SAM-dependent methyltransferase